MKINEKEALEFLKQNLQNENLIKHCLAVQVVMGFLARHFSENIELWSLAGLLHDIDYSQTFDKPKEHSLIAAQMLEEKGLPHELVYAVKCHNEVHGFPRNSLLDKALYCSDPLTGLIVAGVLITNDQKIKNINVEFLMNRFNEKSFARGACREQIASCSELDLVLEEFMQIGLEAMQSIDTELGL